MTILAPLAGLFALALPLIVILHLRRSRPRPLPVTTVRFWEEAVRHQRQRLAPRVPPRTLLLLLQLLIAGLLVFALVRPAIPLPGLPGNAAARQTIVVLDRSTAMRATDVAPTRFARARDRARAIIAGAATDEATALLTLGAEPVIVRSPDAGDRAAALAAVDALEPGGGRADLNAALPAIREMLLPGRENRVVILSGGPFADAPDRAALAALPATVEWERIGGAAPNLAVTRFVARPSAQAPDRQELFARIANYSGSPVSARSVIEADGATVDDRPVTLAPGETLELVRQLPRGARAARLAVDIPAGDAAPFDNEARVILRESGQARILLVSEAAPGGGDLGRALAAQPGATVTVVKPDAYVDRQRYDLTVFERFVPPALPRGAVFLVNPPADNPILPWSRPVGSGESPRIVRIDREDPVLAGVDLSGVTFGPGGGLITPGWATEILGADAGALILAGNFEGREIVAFGFDLTASNLPRKLAFPLLIGNIVERLQTHRVPTAAPLGGAVLFEPVAGTAAVQLRGPGGELRALELRQSAGSVPAAYAVLTQPGLYTLIERDAGGRTIVEEALAVNGGDPIASNLRDLPADLPRATGGAAPGGDGADRVGAGATPRRLGELWPLLLAAVLLLLGLEWIVSLAGPARARPMLERIRSRPGLGERGGRTS